MKKYGYAALAVVVILLVTFVMGSWYGRRNGAKTADGRRILHYVDPMNPAHTSPEPGLAPCGMKMEPVYAGEEEQSSGMALTPGMVKINPTKRQLIGVRTVKVEKAPWTYNLRALGRVAVDENRVYRIQAPIDGLIRQVYPNTTTGSLVQQGAPLADYYNNELYQTQIAHINNLIQIDLMKKGAAFPYSTAQSTGWNQFIPSSIQEAERSLKNLENQGMGKTQIGEITRTRQPIMHVVLETPATSFVLARNVNPGLKFDKGAELYKLADLSHVWIVADLFDKEVQYLRPQDKVQVSLPNQHRTFQATVSEVLPLVDPASRAFKVRLEADNPDYVLRPDMFVDVDLAISLPPAITVPVDAILDAGLTQTVFMDRGNGYFEPRKVKTGQRLGDRVEIIQGLEPGEAIVVSGNFLIDSESRMKLAAAGMVGAIARDLSCQMDVGETAARAAGRISEYQGKTYYFCSDQCKQNFDKTPERYVSQAAMKETKPGAPTEADSQKPEAMPAHGAHQHPAAGIPKESAPAAEIKAGSGAAQDPMHDAGHQPAGMISKESPPPAGGKEETGTASDPFCRENVDKTSARAAGRLSEYQGKTFYFATDVCKMLFDSDPAKYAAGSETPKASSPKPEGKEQQASSARKVKDPVSGKLMDHSGILPSSTYEGQFFFFENIENKQRFDKDPYLFAVRKDSGMPPPAAPSSDLDIQEPQEGTPGWSKDSVSGFMVEESIARAAGLMSEYQGKNYYFLNILDKKNFDKDPQRYVNQAAAPAKAAAAAPEAGREQALPAGMAMDPVCGKVVDQTKAKADRLIRIYMGTTYYFDSKECASTFAKDAQKYHSKEIGPSKAATPPAEAGKPGAPQAEKPLPPRTPPTTPAGREAKP